MLAAECWITSEKLTWDILWESKPPSLLFFMSQRIFCILVPMVYTVYGARAALVPPIQYLLYGEIGLFNESNEDSFEFVITSHEDGIDNSCSSSRCRR